MAERGYSESIKTWPEDERPRERLIKHGAGALSDAQLLAIVLRSGDAGSKRSAVDLARTLLGHFGGFRALDRAPVSELCEVKGIGPAKATEVMAALEIGKRFAREGKGPRTMIRTSSDVARFYFPTMRDLKKEVFKCVLLDGKNRMMKDVTISEGSLSVSVVHPREVFNPVVRESAAAVLFVHNHPSGDPTPSEEDIEVTKQLVEAGKILGIRVLDHVIIGDGRSVSFVELGMM
ncbi:MAG: DNA repair protein RadC [Candidatus Latescibacteria bacterium]|nr:DNA repair protein RadC [Candidatus Latescibacterota bacterium]